jgi:hypothetical protein
VAAPVAGWAERCRAACVSHDGLNVAGNAQGAASGAVANKPELLGDAQGSAAGAASGSLVKNPELISSDAQGSAAGAAKGSLVQKPAVSDAKAPVSNATEQTTESAQPVQPTRALNVSGDANGSASASRESGVAAQGGGSAKVSR